MYITNSVKPGWDRHIYDFYTILDCIDKIPQLEDYLIKSIKNQDKKEIVVEKIKLFKKAHKDMDCIVPAGRSYYYSIKQDAKYTIHYFIDVFDFMDLVVNILNEMNWKESSNWQVMN